MVFNETPPVSTDSGLFPLSLLNQILEFSVIIGIVSVERRCSLKHLRGSESIMIFLVAQKEILAS